MSHMFPVATSSRYGNVLLSGTASVVLSEEGNLQDLAALGVVADNEVMVGTGAGTFAFESGGTLQTSLGLAIGTDVQAFDANLEDLAALGVVADNEFIVGTGAGTYAFESGTTVQTSLGLLIGTDVQAFDVVLEDLAALSAVADNEFIVGTGAGTYAHESGSTARTSMGLGTGDFVEFTQLRLSGRLIVDGSHLSVQSETVLLADNFIDLNTHYTTDAAQAGGIVVNYDPTTTVDTTDTGGFATTTTAATTAAAAFAAGDIIAIWDANNNDNNGYYEVATHAVNVLTITATPTHTFCKNGFQVDTGDTGVNITKIAVGLLQINTSGVWQVSTGSTETEITSNLAAVGAMSLLAGNNTWTGTNDFQDETTTEALVRGFVVVTTTYTVLESDHIIFGDHAGTPFTITLQAATGTGREIVIKNINAATVTVDGDGAETIDGNTTEALLQNASITLIDRASGLWAII